MARAYSELSVEPAGKAPGRGAEEASPTATEECTMTNPNTHAELLNSLGAPDPAETLDGDVLRAEPEESFAPRDQPAASEPEESFAPRDQIWHDPASDPYYDPEYDKGQDRWGHDRWGHNRDHDRWGHHDRDHHRDHWGHRDRDHNRDHDRWDHEGDHGHNPGPVYQTEPEHDYNYATPADPAEEAEARIDPVETHPASEDVPIEPAPEPEPEPMMTEEPAEEAHADVMPIV